jgi:NADH-quinone oxidoreductase subunit C
MNTNEIFNTLKAEFGDAIIEIVEQEASDSFIVVSPDKIFDICHALRDKDEFKFDYMSLLSGMDLGDKIGVVYHLYSFELKHNVEIKTSVPKETPDIASVERIWRTADWHERETWDLFGINFTGHHNLIRILCPYDWEGFPLRKDYVQPDEYHGMKVPY